eukprot:2163128-Pleurochrysis_carterae.AAC.6
MCPSATIRSVGAPFPYVAQGILRAATQVINTSVALPVVVKPRELLFREETARNRFGVRS